MEELLKHGELKLLKESIQPDYTFRESRYKKLKLIIEQAIALPKPTTNRQIYDCEHTTNLRKTLKRSEGQSPVSVALVNTAYDNAGKVRDFYFTQYTYQFVGDNHGHIILNIHYSNNYDNAFWDGDEMIFGDGDGVIFTNFVNSLDVTGHEMTHGVVQYTAGLNYDSQPGALN